MTQISHRPKTNPVEDERAKIQRYDLWSSFIGRLASHSKYILSAGGAFASFMITIETQFSNTQSFFWSNNWYIAGLVTLGITMIISYLALVMSTQLEGEIIEKMLTTREKPQLATEDIQKTRKIRIMNNISFTLLMLGVLYLLIGLSYTS